MADYEEAVSLWRSCEGIGLNESDSPEAIARFIDRNPGLSVIVRDDSGRLVAAVLCGHDGRRGYLHHLAVAPARRRRRIGQFLVRRCLDRLRDVGVQKCSIFLYANNHAGRNFWESHGWTSREDLMILQRATE